MRVPKYTDLHRYPHGYTSAAATNVTKTIARVQREQAQAEAEKQAKVTPIKRRSKT